MAYEFINPYNFIPLSKNAPDRQMEDEAKLYSGVIEYSLLTKSPLFIPNTSNDDAFKCGVKEHKSYDFFSYDDLSDRKESVEKEFHEPVIPGSEIRGMIRSNFEILTNSCLSSLDSDTVMGKRTHEVFKAGLLKKTDGGYELYKAEDCLLRLGDIDDINTSNGSNLNVKTYRTRLLSEGQKIEFNRIERSKGKSLVDNIGNGRSIGYVIKGEKGPELPIKSKEKHCCHVFRCLNEEKILKLNSLAILHNVLKAYGDTYKEYSNKLNRFEKGEGEELFPVYYDFISEIDIAFLAPASITREAYERKLVDIVGEHKSCNSIDRLCPACRLFGTVIAGNNMNARASKLRFSDMKHEKSENCYLSPLTLEPLSTPKLNNMEFYLKRPAEDAIFWTYDYYIDMNGKIYKNTCGINGRKFYWHSLDRKYIGAEKSNLNETVRPLKQGQKFYGKVFFEDLTNNELDQLIYTLNVGDESTELSERQNGYKLGGAKPLGFGSVALSVDRIGIRKYKVSENDKNIKLIEEPYVYYKTPEFDKEILANYSKMTLFNGIKSGTVDYPRIKQNGDIFEWFTENHKAYDRKKKKKTDMPNARTQEYFDMYMKPMEEKLVFTGAGRYFEVEYNISSKEPEKKTDVKTGNIKKGDIIEAKIISCVPDNKKSNNWVATIEYKGKRGKLFDVPRSLKKGDTCSMKVNNPDKIFGNYMQNV